VFVHPPLIISLHQSGFYGQLIPHLTSLLSLNFEMGGLLPVNAGQNKNERIHSLVSFIALFCT
ncbi:hypothetical protein ABEY31_06480, partial [Bacillus mycoides]|uniref:hypothetical protein n=1 Tax=Bacillus mycoides TaxID=1405 RepID=UPI003D1FAD90